MARDRKRKKKKLSQGRISDKISYLRHEGVPQKQAIAEAMSMERSGRLRSGGRYIHKRRKKRDSRRR
jgi:hypothetical protein